MIIDTRYEVQEEYLVGLWATLYEVRDIRSDEIYALRLFHTLDAKSLYEKFSAENMHHITKIVHPNLLQVIDFGNFDTHIYYIRENFEGKSLRMFRYNKANLDLLYGITVQICYALNALHSQNIIHKDLRPDNVLYRLDNQNLQVKLADYGFTKIDFTTGQQTLSVNLPYMAPEVYLGETALPQSDFYSLGVILYKLTTGTLPYTVEQIKNFMAGDQINLFPKFPRELNPTIPDGLERLILKLLERNPEDRFSDIESIISFINQIQLIQYPFSLGLTAANNIRYSDYFVRDDYAHKLLDYIPIVEHRNGKLIVLSAGRGAGKTNILSLMRYHLLTDEYFLYDYQCSPTQRDPFFALIKEYFYNIEKNPLVEKYKASMSEKMRQYLFDSEEKAASHQQTVEELRKDFDTVKNFVFELSEIKPIVLIIRSAEFITTEDIDFVNFISRDIMNRRILIVVSVNDLRKISNLRRTVQINIEPLDYSQTKQYISRLVRQFPPDPFVQQVWCRSNGNPDFIEKILIDLVDRGLIWRNNEYHFNYDFKNYTLPDELVHSVYERLSHLTEENYRLFQKIAVIETPLSKELLKEVIGIDEKKLFFFLQDAINNELIKQDGEYYTVTYTEARDRLISELDDETREDISKRMLNFFTQIEFSQVHILQGVIRHAYHVQDANAVRHFLLKLVQLYSDTNQFELSFETMCEVAELDFTGRVAISDEELHHDLFMLIEKAEWGYMKSISKNLRNHIRHMKSDYFKHFISGVFYLEQEKYQHAEARLVKAIELSEPGLIQNEAMIKLGNLYTQINTFEPLKVLLERLEPLLLTEGNRINFIQLKTLYLGFSGNVLEGIYLSEEYLQTLKSQNNPSFFIKLGSLHNNLALLYRRNRVLDKAEENYELARAIWEKVQYKRKLGIVYNNIGDVLLTKGNTQKALSYFKKALDVCDSQDNKRTLILTLLNHGEAYNKLGQFAKAEEFLNRAFELSQAMESNPFIDSVINNLALAKIKIINFDYYHSFIKRHKPELLRGEILSCSPLVKTYFYYLQNIGDWEQLAHLLNTYEQLFLSRNEHDFYYQMRAFLMLEQKKFNEAIEYIDLAFRHSQQIESVYAQAINYIRYTDYFYETNQIKEAYKSSDKALHLCVKNDFSYWTYYVRLRRVKIQLLDERISLRKILRELFRILDVVTKRSYYLLEIEVFSLVTQIYTHLNVKRKARLYFKHLKEKVKKAIENLDEQDAALFLDKCLYSVDVYQQFKTINIAPRITTNINKWQEELFDILKLREPSRIKFFIGETLKRIFSPSFFAIVLDDELRYKRSPYISFSISSERLYSEHYYPLMQKCLNESLMFNKKVQGNNVYFIPLRLRTTKVGVAIMADSGELNFQRSEVHILRIMRLQLTSILMRIQEFSELNKDMDLMTKLVEMSQKFYTILQIDKLEPELVSFTLEFIGGTRGFLIRKDESENYIYKVALDDSKHLLQNYSYISKTILSDVQKNKRPIFVENARDNNIFGRYVDFEDLSHSIYCAPIIIDGQVYGYIYIDNFRNTGNPISVNKDFMRLLLIQLSLALKNALQYQTLRMKSSEFESLDHIKQEFLNIASHELQTPVNNLMSQLARLRKTKLASREEKLVDKLDENVQRIHHASADIMNYSKFKITKNLNMAPTPPRDVIEAIAEEARQLAAVRHMRIITEIEPELSNVEINWESFQLLLHNLVLNAIRFTKDFGTIVVGTRNSAFQTEKLVGRNSMVFYVQDNGIGIPEHELETVFKELYELNDIYAHSSGLIEFKSSGLGLGLSTSRLIARLHHGKIWLTSKEGEGTTAFVAIPLPDDHTGEGNA
jgi:signal transduction histidine kinase/tetratricopeptide (TPR) repeat protein